MRSYWQRQKKYDVLIKGAGITGLSLAYWINQIRPSMSVAIYEKEYVGAGASGKNAGFLTCGSMTYWNQLQEKFSVQKAMEIWKFHEENHKLLLPFLPGADYEKKGALTLSSSKEMTAKLQEIASLMVSEGVDIKETSLQGFHRAFLYSGDGSMNPVKLLSNLKEKIRADYFFGTQEVEGELVLEATNAFSSHIPFPMPLVPQRSQVLMLSAVPRFLESTCYHFESLTFFKQLASGEFLIGGARTLDPLTEETMELGLNPKIQDYLEKFLKDKFSGLQNQPVIHQWSGIMGFTPDHLPVAGKLDRRRWFLGGYSGHGMGMAFHSSKVLVEHIFQQKPLPWFLDMKRFTPGVDDEETFGGDGN